MHCQKVKWLKSRITFHVILGKGGMWEDRNQKESETVDIWYSSALGKGCGVGGGLHQEVKSCFSH